MSCGFVTSQNVGGFRPTQISGCQIWLDAADPSTFSLTGSTVDTWTDKASSIPFGRKNGTGVTYSNSLVNLASSSFLKNNSGNITIGQTFTIFLVASNTSGSQAAAIYLSSLASGQPGVYIEWTTTTNYRFLYRFPVGVSGGTNVFIPTPTAIIPLTIGTFYRVVSGANYQLGMGINASLTPTTVADTSSGPLGTCNQLAFGTNYQSDVVADRPLTGSIAEIIVYNAELTTAQREQVEGYLAWKWNRLGNIPDLHPYRTIPYLLPKPFDFVPSQLSGLSLWIDAADPSSYTLSGSTVVAVRDKSPRGIPLGTATNWTYITTFNTSYPGFQLSFTPGNLNPAGTLGSSATAPSATPFTVFIVVHANLSTQAGFVIDSLDATGTPRPYIWLLTLSTPFGGFPINYAQNPTIATFGFVAGTGTAYQYPNGDTSLQVTGNLAAGTPTGVRIGNRGTDNQGWPGIIAEILFYSGNMGLSDRQKVEGYLAAKWGLRGNLPATHPFKSISPEGTNPFALVNSDFYTPFLRQSFFNPLIISGCILWWDASDPNVFAGGSTWIDKSGTGNNGITTSVAGNSLPTLGTWPNGNSAAVFTRTGNTTGTSIMTNSTTNPALNYTMFIVMSITGLAPTSDPLGTEQFIFINNLEGARQIKTNTSSTAGFPATLTVHFTNASSINLSPTVGQNQGFLLTYVVPPAGGALGNVYLNGATPQTQTTLASGVSRFYFGSANNSANRYFTGQIGEILIYNSVLSDLDRQRMEGYLAWKWGIPGNLPQTHPFKLFAPPESSPDGPPPVPPPPPFSGWSIVLDGADASVNDNGGGSFTCNGPNDGGGQGWAYIYGFFSTAGSITYNFNWFTGDDLTYDWPFEWVTSNDPSNPGNVNFNTKIASANSQSGSRTVSYGANQYVVLGVYSVDSIFGNGVCTFSGLPT